MQNNNYIVIQGWMVNELKLTGNELLVYSIIYGFSQDGESVYKGSSAYLADCLKISRQSIFTILKKLTDKGLIIKQEKIINNVKLVDYIANLTILTNFTGYQETLQGGIKKVDRGYQETLHHNNSIDNNIDNSSLIKEKNKTINSFIKKKSTSADRPDVEAWGEFKNVYLTKDEIKKLIKNYGWYFTDALELLSGYIARKGKDPYINHYAVFSKHNWIWKDVHKDEDCGMRLGKTIKDDSVPGGLRNETPEEYYTRTLGI